METTNSPNASNFSPARRRWLDAAAADLDAGRITRRQYESIVWRAQRAEDLDRGCVCVGGPDNFARNDTFTACPVHEPETDDHACGACGLIDGPAHRCDLDDTRDYETDVDDDGCTVPLRPAVCPDCARPTYFDNADDAYHHAVDASRGCFLIGAEDRPDDRNHPLVKNACPACGGDTQPDDRDRRLCVPCGMTFVPSSPICTAAAPVDGCNIHAH